jgi:MYXO-CTERM domain-containing protein
LQSCVGTSTCVNPSGPAINCTIADCNAGIFGCTPTACIGTTACTSAVGHQCGEGTCFSNGCNDNLPGCLTASCIDPGRTCSASNCQSAIYCDYTAAQCETLGSGLSCSSLLDQQACQAEANGCSWNPSGSCANTTSISCANLESSQCGTPEFPGCSPTTCPTGKDAADVIIFRSGAGCSTTNAGSVAVTALVVLFLAVRRRKPS